MEIIDSGNSLNKLLPNIINKFFCDEFEIKRPIFSQINLDRLKEHFNSVFIFSHKEKTDITFRGEFEWLEAENQMMFLGVPWFKSMDQVLKNGLAIKDFAMHDNFTDFMHVIQSLEIAHNDSVQLLKTVSNQKNELKKNEQYLKETSLRLSQVIENIEGGILVENESRQIVLVNQKYCDLFTINSTPDSLIGQDCTNAAEQYKNLFIEPEIFVQRINIILRKKEKVIEEKLKLADGRFFVRDYVPIFQDEIYQGHLWKYTDITESVIVEEKLDHQRQFYEQILNEIPADISVFDKDRHYLFINPVAIHNPGLRSWLIGKTDEEYCNFRNRPLSIAKEREKIFNKVVEQGYQLEWEEKSMNAHGETNYHLRKMYPVFDEDGKLDIMIGYGVDITERKRIEEQIKLSETKFREIFDFSQALICTHDLDGRMLTVNNSIVHTLEYTAQELVGQYFYSVMPKSKALEFGKTYLEEILTKRKSEGVMIAVTKSGKKVHLLYQNYLLQDPGSEPYVIGFAQNITERINAENALRKSEEKYRSIIRNMNLGLMEVDLFENIIYANQSFCDMSGYSEEELIGKNAKELFVRGENLKTIEEKSELRKNNISDAYEIALKNKRGEVKWWLVSGAPKIDEDGRTTGSIGIHLDITLQKQLEQELRKAKSEAEFSAHAKEIFLANMSHEIRTPMNAIIGMGRLLNKTVIDNQQKFYVNAIQNAADNLLVIINDILDFSKIEAGKVAIEKIGFRLKQVIDQAVLVLKYKAEEKDLLLHYSIDDNIAPVLLGDPFRLNQVLLNMLSNSIKFTEKGSVSIRCFCMKSDEYHQQIRIDIEDTGIGMSTDFLNHLFDKFTQEDESITRKFGGTGLGMSISKQLVELMSGKIEVKSLKNKGTTISIYLNMNIGQELDLPQKNENMVDVHTLKNKNILLVEDNPMNRLLASTILKDYGAEVDEAEDGEIAIQKVLINEYDLILMDIQMPNKNGLETTLYIREHINTSIPIIALTANAIKGEAERCLSVGMNDFISKPFEEEKMIQLVAKWLGKEVAIVHEEHEIENTETQLYNLDNLIKISRGNQDFVVKMVQLFLEEIPISVDQIILSLGEKDYKKLNAIIHRLKPSIQNLCIESTFILFKQLEILGLNADSATENPEFEAMVLKTVVLLNETIQQLGEDSVLKQ